jgi:hypothetical protein
MRVDSGMNKSMLGIDSSTQRSAPAAGPGSSLGEKAFSTTCKTSIDNDAWCATYVALPMQAVEAQHVLTSRGIWSWRGLREHSVDVRAAKPNVEEIHTLGFTKCGKKKVVFDKRHST